MEPNERKQAYWRRLSASDIRDLARVANRIHRGLPEADEFLPNASNFSQKAV